jgi:entericidin B
LKTVDDGGVALRHFSHRGRRIRFFKACSAWRPTPSSIASTKQETVPMKKFAAALLAVALIPALAACNTVKGIGEAVEEVAKEVEKEITE